MPLHPGVEDVLGELQRGAHRVAVVVVRDVLAPVDEPRIVLARVGEVPLVDVDHLVAAVDLDHRRDQRDQVVADRLDVLVIVDDQAVGELHQRGRRAGFRRVDRAGDVVDRRRRGDQRFRLRIVHVDGARIAELREPRAVLVELRHDRVRGDRDGDHLASFFGLADGDDLDAAGRGLLEHAHVLVDLFGVRQLAGRAGDVAQHRLRRRHRFRRGEVVHQRRAEERLGRVLLDLLAVLDVDGNLGVADERLRLLRRERRRQQCAGDEERQRHGLLHGNLTK